jgi:hypothetical protein
MPRATDYKRFTDRYGNSLKVYKGGIAEGDTVVVVDGEGFLLSNEEEQKYKLFNVKEVVDEGPSVGRRIHMNAEGGSWAEGSVYRVEPNSTKPRFRNARFWTDFSSLIKDGQRLTHLRGELSDIPANTITIPPSVLVFIAEDLEAANIHEKFVGLMEVNRYQTVITTGRSRKEVKESLDFMQSFSHYAPSTLYREFRRLLGFEYSTVDEYTTPPLRADTQERCLKALAVMAGVDITKLNEGDKE